MPYVRIESWKHPSQRPWVEREIRWIEGYKGLVHDLRLAYMKTIEDDNLHEDDQT